MRRRIILGKHGQHVVHTCSSWLICTATVRFAGCHIGDSLRSWNIHIECRSGIVHSRTGWIVCEQHWSNERDTMRLGILSAEYGTNVVYHFACGVVCSRTWCDVSDTVCSGNFRSE